MKKLPLNLLAFLLAILPLVARAQQDPQFTQFYAAPLYVNPAFTGSTAEGRLVANYRNQWPGLEASFVTYSFSYDQFFPRIKSGIGFMAKRDEQGGGIADPLAATNVTAFYSYLVPVNDRWFVQAGLQAGYGQRDFNFGSFTFDDQFDPRDGFTGQPTAETFPTDRIGHFDFSAGLLIFSEQFWGGFSVKHLNTPNIAFTVEEETLQRRISAHAGYQIPLGGRGRREAGTLTPAVMYIGQGAFSQLSAGCYFNYNVLLAGLWYRGVPFKNTHFNGVNQDAVAVLAGVQLSTFSVGYSYDYTLSQLTNTGTWGAHEISLIYNFKPKEKGRKKRIKYPAVGCPNPWKRYQKLRYRHVYD